MPGPTEQAAQNRGICFAQKVALAQNPRGPGTFPLRTKPHSRIVLQPACRYALLSHRRQLRQHRAIHRHRTIRIVRGIVARQSARIRDPVIRNGCTGVLTHHADIKIHQALA